MQGRSETPGPPYKGGFEPHRKHSLRKQCGSGPIPVYVAFQAPCKGAAGTTAPGPIPGRWMKSPQTAVPHGVLQAPGKPRKQKSDALPTECRSSTARYLRHLEGRAIPIRAWPGSACGGRRRRASYTVQVRKQSVSVIDLIPGQTVLRDIPPLHDVHRLPDQMMGMNIPRCMNHVKCPRKNWLAARWALTENAAAG